MKDFPHKQKIETLHAPQAIGPYSQGILSNGMLYCSGQIPIDPQTGGLITGDITAQTQQVMKNIGHVLKAANLEFSDVVKTTIFLKNLSHFKLVNECYGSYFIQPYPARSTIQVADLPLGAEIEIEVIAKVKN